MVNQAPVKWNKTFSNAFFSKENKCVKYRWQKRQVRVIYIYFSRRWIYIALELTLLWYHSFRFWGCFFIASNNCRKWWSLCSFHRHMHTVVREFKWIVVLSWDFRFFISITVRLSCLIPTTLQQEIVFHLN